MSNVKVTSTELVGELSYTTTYEFSSFEDFTKWESDKRKALMQSMTGSINDIFSIDLGENSPEDIAENMENVFRAAVKKKNKMH